MKSRLLIVMMLAGCCYGWGQDNKKFGVVQNVSDPLDIQPKDSVVISENQKVIDSLKRIINQQSDAVEIGEVHSSNYAIIFKKYFPVDEITDFELVRERINDSIKKKKLYQKVELIANKDLIAKKKYWKNNDSIIFAKKGEKYTLKIGYIDSISIAINEGVIEHIRVHTKEGDIFTNGSSPIPLLTIEKRFEDKLINPRDGSFIFLKDAVYFEANRRFNYFPENSELKLKNTLKEDGTIVTSSKKLVTENGINSLVNLQVYSDLLGVFGNEANGIIQFEANSKFYLHRGNYNNTYIYKPGDAIEPFFHFSRIDSKFDTIAVSAGQQVNRMELFRRYTYAVGLDINLFRADFRPHNSFEIKAGYMYSSSNLNVEGNKITASLHTPYGELVLKSKKLNNFALDLRGRFLFQKLNKNEIIENDEWNQLISFRAGISYFPNKMKSDKIFLRFVNYLNLSDRKEDFSLLQLGFSKAISF